MGGWVDEVGWGSGVVQQGGATAERRNLLLQHLLSSAKPLRNYSQTTCWVDFLTTSELLGSLCISGDSQCAHLPKMLGMFPAATWFAQFVCQQQNSVYWQILACIITPMPSHQTHHHIVLGRPKLRDRKVLIGALAEQEPRALSKQLLGVTITKTSSPKKWSH